MNYTIDHSISLPAYLQLYHLIVRDITDGIYPEGSRLPSKRIMALDTGVSVITVQHTMELLCEEGYAESRMRSGYFVIYKSSDFKGTFKELSEGGDFCFVQQDPYSPKVASPSGSFPFTVLSKTIRKVLSDYGNDILIKSPEQGCMTLRIELSAYLARSRGIHVSPSQIIIGSGAEYLYGLIAQLLKDSGTFALEDPSYDKIYKVYTSLGINCEKLPLTEHGISSDELENTCASVLHVTPFHSFPSGVTVNISKKQEYISWARKRNGWIVEDNFDSELTVSKKEEDSLFAISAGDRVIYINTFSKTIAPSIRIGYMVLPKLLLERFQNRLGFYSCTVPVLDQYVLSELLKSGDFERNINRIRRKRRKEAQQNQGEIANVGEVSYE